MYPPPNTTYSQMYKQERGCVWVLIPCFIVEWKKGLKDNPLCSDIIQLPLTVPIVHLNAQQTGCCPMDLRFPLFLLTSIRGRHSPSHSCPTLGFNTSSRSHTLCVTLTPQSPETSSVNLRSISICLSDSLIIWPCCSWLYAPSQFTLKSPSGALSWTVFHGSWVLSREAGSYEHYSLGYFADLPSLFISKPECHQQCPSNTALCGHTPATLHWPSLHPFVQWLYHHPSLPWNICWADIQETAMSTSVNSTHLDKFRKLWT